MSKSCNYVNCGDGFVITGTKDKDDCLKVVNTIDKFLKFMGKFSNSSPIVFDTVNRQYIYQQNK
jgi:hypothetical protein